VSAMGSWQRVSITSWLPEIISSSLSNTCCPGVTPGTKLRISPTQANLQWTPQNVVLLSHTEDKEAERNPWHSSKEVLQTAKTSQ
jgi:hypothetical protein